MSAMFGKAKRENQQLREALAVATKERDQVKEEVKTSEGRATLAEKQATQAEEDVQKTKAESREHIASMQKESEQTISDAEQKAEQEREQKLDTYLVPGTPLIFLENPANQDELQKVENMIDSVTKWQVENVINAEATVRRNIARVGAELRKAMIAKKSGDDLKILKDQLDSLIDELQQIRGRAEKYEQGVVDEYSAMKNVTRMLEGMKDRIENNESLTKEEIEVLYEKDVDLKNILNRGLYNEITTMRGERDRKKDFSILYDCDESQITDNRDLGRYADFLSKKEGEKHPFSGDIVYHDGSLEDDWTYPYSSYSKRGGLEYQKYKDFFLNRLRFPDIVGGDVLLKNGFFYKEGIDFPRRVEGSLTTEMSIYTDEHQTEFLKIEDITFPEYVESDCVIEGGVYHGIVGGGDGHIPYEKRIPCDDVKLPKYVGGSIKLSGFASVKNTEFPEYVGGNIDLRYITTAEGFECPESVGGKVILSHELRNDANLHIPKGVDVYWVQS